MDRADDQVVTVLVGLVDLVADGSIRATAWARLEATSGR